MSNHNRTAFKQRVHDILRRHDDAGCAITKEALWVQATGEVLIPWRRIDQTRPLRSIIAELQRDGVPVVHSREGYYLAENDADIAREATWHRSRAFAAFRREQSLRKITSRQLLLEYQIDLQLQDLSTPTQETPHE